MLDDKIVASVTYLGRWSLGNAMKNADTLMMHLNQPIPLAYCHLLELITTIYCFTAPLGLVPALLWIAVWIAPVVTFFFYGFFVLGTCMLMDPFQKDSGFDTESMLTANILSMESIERNVPLSFAKRNTHRRSSFP